MNRQFNPSGYNQYFFNPAPQTFTDYQQRCHQMIQHVRNLTHYCPQTDYINQVTPYQLGHSNSKRGILLLHGLLETPFLLRDIADHFAAKGYLVRAILLPGHGTCPGDLLNTDYHAWEQACHYGIASLREKVDELYVCGYSTGAALALSAAYNNTLNNIDGLILFAPALKIRHYSSLLANLLRAGGHVISRLNWLSRQHETDFARYHSLPLNGAYQVYQLSRQLANLSKSALLDLPLFIIATTDDTVVCHRSIINFFQQQPHHDNRLLLYSPQPPNLKNKKITWINSRYPDDNIAHFSHICLGIAPENFHYGKQGDYPIPLNANVPRRYSLLHRRYASHYPTYNPHFHSLMTEIDSFLDKISS